MKYIYNTNLPGWNSSIYLNTGMDEEHGGEERTHRNNSGPGDDEQDCLSRSTIRPWRLATMTIDERSAVAGGGRWRAASSRSPCLRVRPFVQYFWDPRRRRSAEVASNLDSRAGTVRLRLARSRERGASFRGSFPFFSISRIDRASAHSLRQSPSLSD
jgi:hypothetical protein